MCVKSLPGAITTWLQHTYDEKDKDYKLNP